MKRKIFSLVLVKWVSAFMCLAPSVAFSLDETKVIAETKSFSVSEKLKTLTLDQKLGQLFVFGINGKGLSKSNLRVLRNYKPGGIIIFSRNISSPDQIAKFNHSIQAQSEKVSGLPLLIMVDQEGGSVTRIKTQPSAPSALALGMTKDLGLIKHAGRISGEILSLLGFNMNLAPVLDISPPEKKNFIGNRSFGFDPDSVKVMAQSFSEGQLETGIIPTAKHFPGHGKIIQDSHKTLPIKLDDIKTLSSTDLVPFKHFIKHSSPSAIMIAHIAFPNIDPTGVPAAFSSVLVNDLLRDRLGYNGLVVTDDIEMAGADSVGDIGERAVRALEAGCDLIMVAWSPARQGRALEAVKRAVASGRLSMDRIDDSLRRILRAKMNLPVRSKRTPTTELITNKMRGLTSDLKALTHRVSHSNFKKSARHYPHLKGQVDIHQQVLIFSSDSSFFRSFRNARLGRVKTFALSPKRADPVGKVVKKYPQSLFVYYVTGSGTARRLRKLSKEIKSKLVVVNSTNPGLIGNDEDFKAVFDIHSQNFEAGRWVAEFLFERDLRLPSSRPEQAKSRTKRNSEI